MTHKGLKGEALDDWLYDFFHIALEDYSVSELLEAYDIAEEEALIRLYYLGLIELEEEEQEDLDD